MSFGVEQSQSAGGRTLGGFIAEKAVKSRDDAKKEKEKQKKVEEKGGQVDEKDKKGLFRKALAHNLGGGFLSGKKSFGEHFNYKMPPKPKSTEGSSGESSGSSGSSSGGTGAGLAKILTGGFGSLVADTTAIQGGLTAITQLLNSQLQSSSFTANGITGVTAILADQLEAQGELIDLMGGERPTGSPTPIANMFGMSGAAGTGGKTLTEAMMEGMVGNAIRKFLQRGFQGALDNVKKILPKAGGELAEKVPGAAAKAGAETAESIAKKKLAQEIVDKGLKSKGAMIGGKYVSVGAEEAATILAKKGATEGAEGFLTKMGGPLSNVASKVGWKGVGKALKWLPLVGAVPSLIEAVDDARKGDIMGALLSAGSAIPLAGWGFMAADITRDVVGKDSFDNTLGEAFQAMPDAMSMAGLSSGGVMLGEAGKEAVVDLNTREGKTLQGTEDPAMKASGGSMLAVVDQFVKGMGPLGAPVAQAIGPDIQNLSRKFGMSQVLPNLRIGGGKFREDGNAKKERNKFLENLIAGSLESLDAKKKDDKTTGTQTTQTKEEQKKQSNPDNPDTGSATQAKTGADGKPMDVHDPLAYGAGRQSVVTGTLEGVGITDIDKNRQTGQLEANHSEFDYNGSRYKVRINPNNGDYEVFKKGANFGFDQKIDVGGPQGPKKGQANEAILRLAHNEVRRFFLVNAPQKGLALKYINQGDIDRNRIAKQKAMVNGDQQRGGIVKQEFDRGGLGVLDDFLKNTAGNVGGDIGAREGRRRTGNLPILGDVGERIGRNRGRNQGEQVYENLTSPFRSLGFEKGGSMFGVTNIKNELTVDQRLDDVEKVLAMMTGVLGIVSGNVSTQSGTQQPPKPASPKSSPSSPPIAATNQVANEMSEAAIINVIGGGGSSPTIQKPQNTVQNTAEYASDPTCNGLASVLCLSSPWGSM